MPIYAYRCSSCGEQFEKYRRMQDSDEEITCPACAAPGPRRVLSSVYAGNSSGSGQGGGFSAPT